ncbi:MAG: polyprenyl synthetase family protein [Gammaproteobacteria bacterium]|nr:polyprenyl synthetase family protein [Gammaproteobacteria bacterium]
MTIIQSDLNLKELFELAQTRLLNNFEQYMKDVPSQELREVMQYSFINGGKRFRPLLVYATGSIFGTSWEYLDQPALAVELIHTYSLVHDDLPCMDNADLRRGKPTCHKQFDEAIALLAGDAYQTLAFQVLSDKTTPNRALRQLAMVEALARAAGPLGMVAGQALDIRLLKNEILSEDAIKQINQLKTGALLSVSVMLGWLASSDTDADHEEALQIFGQLMGEAFQLQDDIFDITQDEKTTGKPQHLDERNAKLTFPARVGIPEAEAHLTKLYEKALSSLNCFGEKAHLLRELATYLLNRKQ